jgi:hypothetical protein
VRDGWRGNGTAANEPDKYGLGLPFDMYVCPDQDEPQVSSCPGYALNETVLPCRGNHSSALCASCGVGFSKHGFDCVPCARLAELSFGLPWNEAALMIAAGCVGCLAMKVCFQAAIAKLEIEGKQGLVKAAAAVVPVVAQIRAEIWCNVRILLGMFQIMSLLQVSLDITFPVVFSVLTRWMGLASADTGGLMTLFQFGCHIKPEHAFLYGWVLKVFLLPLVISMILLIVYWFDRRKQVGVEQDLSSEELLSGLDEQGSESQAIRAAKNNLKSNFFDVVCLLYPWTSSTIISALHCRQLGPQLSVLVHDYRVSCDTQNYVYLYRTAAVMALLVPIGVPFALYVWMERITRLNMRQYLEGRHHQVLAKKRLARRLLWNPWPVSVLEMDHDVDTMRVSNTATDFATFNNKRLQVFQFILYEYEDGWVRYEPLDILRKLSLTAGLEFAWRGTGLQRLVACSIAVAFMCLQVHCTPYRERNSNLLKTAADANILLAITVSMLLHSESMQPSVGGTVAAAEPFQRDKYGWMLVTTTSLVVLGCLAECVNRVRRMWRVKARVSDGFLSSEVALHLRVGGAFVAPHHDEDASHSGSSMFDVHQERVAAENSHANGSFTVE